MNPVETSVVKLKQSFISSHVQFKEVNIFSRKFRAEPKSSRLLKKWCKVSDES